MIIFSKIFDYNLSDSIVTVGMFDGVHRGHQSILDYLKRIAQQKNLFSVVVTFDEHPQYLHLSKNDFKLLTSNKEKIEMIKKSGIDAMVFITFDNTFSKLSYSDFINNILIKKISAKTVLMGYDNRFGSGGNGSYINVSNISEQLGIDVVQINELDPNDHISSSRIRKSMVEGDIRTVNRLLGYSYGFDATIIEGNKIGREICYPTANLSLVCSEKLMPNFGVYATKIFFDDKTYLGILNYGLRPTINKTDLKPLAEVHIFNFSDNLYGKEIRVELIEKIRSEMKFNSIEELKHQIKLDIEQCSLINNGRS